MVRSNSNIHSGFADMSSAVSVVDGFNLPVQITNTAGCPDASCPQDLNLDCQYSGPPARTVALPHD